MTIKVGDRLPLVTFMEISNGSAQPLSSDDLFRGRKVALFAVPGAFTSTCSAKHLPSFLNNSGALREKGADDIVCVAVNDPFVMRAWGERHHADGKVRMVADGNGEFARALGLEVDMSRFGMGRRSRRYSMLVDDGVVKILNLEEPGSFSVSSGDHLLKQLD
ncbi:MAG: peroxiredoxin [Alphaproteobacteria bacterium]